MMAIQSAAANFDRTENRNPQPYLHVQERVTIRLASGTCICINLYSLRATYRFPQLFLSHIVGLVQDELQQPSSATPQSWLLSKDASVDART